MRTPISMASELSIRVAALLAAAALAAPASAELPPYDLDKTCHAVTTIALERHLLPPRTTVEEVRALSQLYAKRAAASGAKAGLAQDRIDRDQTVMRDAIREHLSSADAAVAAKERTDTTRMEGNCAAVIGLEMMRKPE